MTDKIIALVDDSIYATSVCEHAAWASGRMQAPESCCMCLDGASRPGHRI